jgi:hypothetical protein
MITARVRQNLESSHTAIIRDSSVASCTENISIRSIMSGIFSASAPCAPGKASVVWAAAMSSW